MPPTPRPVALLPHLPSELLTYILAQESHPTTLIICSTRAAFLSSLYKVVLPSDPPPSPLQSLGHGDPRLLEAPPLQPAEPHPLLRPTLRQLSISRHITTAFVPTLSHLRAYLSVFPPSSASSSPAPSPMACKARDTGTSPEPLLAVYGLVKLHRETSEWSAQGLSCTAATLVEAGWRAGARVVLIEDAGAFSATAVGDDGDFGAGTLESFDDDGNSAGGGAGAGSSDDGMARRARVPESDMRRQLQRRRVEYWRETLPMLNGSVRRSGAEMEYGGRTVEVGVVLRRWFLFENGGAHV